MDTLLRSIKGSAKLLVQSLILLSFKIFFVTAFIIFSAPSNAEENHFPQVKHTQPAEQDNYLIEECLGNKYTHKSCKKVFCHPWERCVEGKCLCKLPYQCPKNGSAVCSSGGKNFRTYCQLKSYECQQPKAKFLHRGMCKPEGIHTSFSKIYPSGVAEEILTLSTESLLVFLH